MSGDTVKIWWGPEGELIDLEAIPVRLLTPENLATGLSRINRWVGTGKRHYSVARHSVDVGRLAFAANPRLALQGLLHDAAEAFVGDMSSPLKAECPHFRHWEHVVYRQIADRFGIPAEIHPLVKMLDGAAARSEREVVFGAIGRATLHSDDRDLWLYHFDKYARFNDFPHNTKEL